METQASGCLPSLPKTRLGASNGWLWLLLLLSLICGSLLPPAQASIANAAGQETTAYDPFQDGLSLNQSTAPQPASSVADPAASQVDAPAASQAPAIDNPAADETDPLPEQLPDSQPANAEDAAEEQNAAEADAQATLASPAQPAREKPAAEPVVFVPLPDPVLTADYQKLAIIEIDGPIFGRFDWYLRNRLEWAREQAADVVIVRLTSPGGDLELSLNLARELRDIPWATTIVYIPQEAISGGAIIALGADRIYMQSRSLIGDAGPIQMRAGGQFEHVEEKVISYTAESIASIAKAQARPGPVAEAMVDRNLIVFQARELATGKLRYFKEKDTQAADFLENYAELQQVPETGENRFLTVSAQRALELQLCEGVFESEQQLVEALAASQVIRTQITWTDKTVYLLNLPWLTGILLIIGLIGLYLELAAPGIGAGGLTALICFSLFFWSHALGGTAGWLEVLLFALAIVCLACEMFVVPGFGVFGISGIGLLIVALVMATQSFLVPENAAQWTQLRTNSFWVLSAVFGVILLGGLQLLFLDSLPGLKRFQLKAHVDTDQASDMTITHLTGQTHSAKSPINIGDSGVADSDLRPAGKVKIGNALIDVVTEGDYVEAGTPVDVLRVDGNRIIVRRKV